MSESLLNSQANAHVLACPVCQLPLVQQERRFACAANHSFDLAKQGYLNLLLVNHKRSKAPGDNAEMIQARQRFLDQGYYQPISDRLNQLVQQQLGQPLLHSPAQLADVGCGNGYYSLRLLHSLTAQATDARLYGIDISKDALKAAARRSRAASSQQAVHWLVASGKRLPVLPHSLDVITSLFTPVMPDGAHQALKTGGKLILATTGQHHLLELRRAIYPNVNERVFDPTDKLQQSGFRLVSEGAINLNASACIDGHDLPDLLTMTPHGWRSTAEARAELLTLPQLDVTLDVDFRIFEAEATT